MLDVLSERLSLSESGVLSLPDAESLSDMLSLSGTELLSGVLSLSDAEVLSGIFSLSGVLSLFGSELLSLHLGSPLAGLYWWNVVSLRGNAFRHGIVWRALADRSGRTF